MALTLPVYMDYHATTPLHPAILEAMMPFLTTHHANPASNHPEGWLAARAVEHARGQVAALIGADPAEITFTSGATESNNLALKGMADRLATCSERRAFVTTQIEHPSVLDTVRSLEKRDFPVRLLPVDAFGVVNLDALREAARGALMVSLMAANNEIGTLQPLSGAAAICCAEGALLHSDASQAAGKVPLDVRCIPVDMLSFTAHKMCGPKGVGALWIRRRRPRIRLVAQMDGGGHEGGLRSGTMNVPAIVGFGAACEIAACDMAEESARLATLRDRLRERVMASLPGVWLNGHPDLRTPGNLSLGFEGIEGESLVIALPDVALSAGSACASRETAPSHVLTAIGLSPARARSCVRFGLGRFTTQEEVDYAARRVVTAVRSLRGLSTRGTIP